MVAPDYALEPALLLEFILIEIFLKSAPQILAAA